jgi:hypothetical protein
MTDFPESKLDWLIKKFGVREGWFNATDIARKGDNAYKARDWRKLMELAVSKGLAYSSDSFPYRKQNGKAVKNSITFCPPPTFQWFDDYILNHSYFVHLPQELFLSMGVSTDSREFSIILNQWCNVYDLLCGLQYHGVMDEKLLDDELPKWAKKHLMLEADEIFVMYGLLVYVMLWARYERMYLRLKKPRPVDLVDRIILNIALDLSSRAEIDPSDNYNKLFLAMLYARYKRMYPRLKTPRRVKLADATMLTIARELQIPADKDLDSEVSLDDCRRFAKLMGGTDEEHGISPVITHFANCGHIRQALHNSSNPVVRKLSTRLNRIVDARMAERTKALNQKPSDKN